jgi:hypothetical protein
VVVQVHVHGGDDLAGEVVLEVVELASERLV